MALSEESAAALAAEYADANGLAAEGDDPDQPEPIETPRLAAARRAIAAIMDDDPAAFLEALDAINNSG